MFVKTASACENIDMSDAKLEAYFFTVILLLVLVIVGVIFYPFLGSLALAVVLASLGAPLHRQLQKKITNQNVSAFLVTLVITVAIIGPAVGLSFLLVDEVQNITESAKAHEFDYIPAILDTYKEKIVDVFPIVSTVTFPNVLQKTLENLDSVVTKTISITGNFLLKFFVALIALYYFIKDGRHFLKEIIHLSPLDDSEDVTILWKLDRVAHSLIRGTLVIAILQGLLVGLGFLMFGIPNPVLWGSLAAVSALIPTVGTSVVTLPAIIYLFVTGNIAAGIGLLGWSTLIVGLVDNVIAPKLIGAGAKIHPLFVLLSVLGGILFFGISGFILGPLLFGFLMALSEIYKIKIKEIHEHS